MTILILLLLGSPGERQEKQHVNTQDHKRGRQHYFHIHTPDNMDLFMDQPLNTPTIINLINKGDCLVVFLP
jgi:hypothetical protein